MTIQLKESLVRIIFLILLPYFLGFLINIERNRKVCRLYINQVFGYNCYMNSTIFNQMNF